MIFFAIIEYTHCSQKVVLSIALQTTNPFEPPTRSSQVFNPGVLLIASGLFDLVMPPAIRASLT